MHNNGDNSNSCVTTAVSYWNFNNHHSSNLCAATSGFYWDVACGRENLPVSQQRISFTHQCGFNCNQYYVHITYYKYAFTEWLHSSSTLLQLHGLENLKCALHLS